MVVRVDRAGRAPGSVAVRLMYGVGGSPGYEGEAWMKYDAGRQAYVYTLPPVTREKVGDRAAGAAAVWITTLAILFTPFALILIHPVAERFQER